MRKFFPLIALALLALAGDGYSGTAPLVAVVPNVFLETPALAYTHRAYDNVPAVPMRSPGTLYGETRQINPDDQGWTRNLLEYPGVVGEIGAEDSDEDASSTNADGGSGSAVEVNFNISR